MQTSGVEHDVEAAILVDEAGIHTGRCGDVRLKTLFQPVFALEAGRLEPVGVTARIQPRLFGRPLAASEFAGLLAETDRARMRWLELELPIRNLPNAGVEGAGLHLEWHEDLAEMWEAARRRASLEGETLDNPLLCRLDASSAVGLLRRNAAHARQAGLGVCLAQVGALSGIQDACDAAGPDIAALDAAWFRRVAAAPPAAALLARFVSRLKAGGSRVMIEGIETVPQLRIAAECGADLLQGTQLAGPAPAGAGFGQLPASLGEALPERANVIQLPGKHQRR